MNKTKTLEIRASSFDAALAGAYEELSLEYDENNMFRVSLRSVEFVTRQGNYFTYIFDCYFLDTPSGQF